MGSVIRVFVVDDHTIVRKGLKALLATVPEIDMVGEAENGKEAVEAYPQLRPDVILMDLEMPVMNGIDAIREIKQIDSKALILVLTSFATDDKVFPAVKAGAMGYLLKDSTPTELMDAVQKVYAGEPSLHPTIARKLLMELSAKPETGSIQVETIKKTALESGQDELPEPLTMRELEILKLIAKGLSNREISESFFISEATVRTHVSNVLSKLHLASRTQAALYALRAGLAYLEE